MKAAFGLVLGLAFLAGCVGGGSGGPTLRVLDGTFALAAPRGFCPDPAQLRERDETAFALYGTCQGIEGRGPAPLAPAVLTAAVAREAGALDAGDFAALADHLGSVAGKAALARGDGAANAEVLSLERDANLILVHVRDRDTIDLSEDYWRAVFVQSGALVTLTASGTAQAALAPDTGKALLLAFVRAVRAANPAAAEDIPEAESAARPGLFKHLLKVNNSGVDEAIAEDG
jgi:hypothetical protein